MKPILAFNILAILVGISILFTPLWFIGLLLIPLSTILILVGMQP